MRFGVILAFAMATKRLGLSDIMADKYTILRNGKVLYKNLTEEEYFDRMEDLSIEFYQTGHPSAQELETKIFKEI